MTPPTKVCDAANAAWRRGADWPEVLEIAWNEGRAEGAAAERDRIREHILNRARQLEAVADKATITELRILAKELGWTGADLLDGDPAPERIRECPNCQHGSELHSRADFNRGCQLVMTDGNVCPCRWLPDGDPA